MVDNQEKTEEKILKAAEEVFQKKGMTGARMQEIADTAGINKALLHYYYRTKDKLFEKVINMAFSKFFPRVINIMGSGISVFEKIEVFVSNYLDLIAKHPFIPGFVINELNRNPQILISLFEKNIRLKEEGLIDKFNIQLQEEVEQGIIKPIDARNLMVNIVGLCIFPIVAKPIVQGVIFGNDKKQYNDFLKQRKEHVIDFVISSIKMD